MPRFTQTKPLREPSSVRSSLRVDVGQDGGQQFDRLVLVDDAPRLGEHRHRLDVGRQDLAVAVEDVGPGAGKFVGDNLLEALGGVREQAQPQQLGVDGTDRALDGVVLSDGGPASPTWLAGFETCTVDNITGR